MLKAPYRCGMKTFETHNLPSRINAAEREWVYNGLDACITAELLAVLLPQLDSLTSRTYAFSRSLQGPVLEMRLRGVRVDTNRRDEVIDQYTEKLERLEENLQQIVGKGLGLHEFKWQSPRDLQELFYGKLKLRPLRRQGHVTVDRAALEKLEASFAARPIIRHLTAMRELGKRISVLRQDIDNDGRIRTSYNIAGTNTGRFSSSSSEFGTGTNLQNIEDALRSVFIADPGYKMAYFDAEQGESRCVGAIEYNLFDDGRYLDACESGDLHTTVARLVWPDLNWPGNSEADRELAERPYYRHYSRRFMCKKIGHGSNYGGRPQTLAAQAKVEQGLIEDFQPAYFAAFPAHLKWHEYVRREIYDRGKLVSLAGRLRHFWSRRDADDTIREAIAYDPQGSLADIVNRGMLAVWRHRDCQLLMQNHDAIVVQYPEEREGEVIPKILKQLEYPIPLAKGRTLLIPYGCKVGWNFGEHSEENPNGLQTYNLKSKRIRAKEATIMDRQVLSFHRRSWVGRKLSIVGGHKRGSGGP